MHDLGCRGQIIIIIDNHPCMISSDHIIMMSLLVNAILDYYQLLQTFFDKKTLVRLRGNYYSFDDNYVNKAISS